LAGGARPSAACSAASSLAARCRVAAMCKELKRLPCCWTVATSSAAVAAWAIERVRAAAGLPVPGWRLSVGRALRCCCRALRLL